ncbi:hypothetical protein LO763_22790 [Glycomyces sp. A-F 0318]|uniref:hypothetical protein n=1 Tax=Glycomyces amatae TaxID=2881355 RepID=UPI001E31B720|nr:hypothetical protein [Glycomyces amatae]MCD0446447.1 hypothetical protein [Glycomyces amatae]
MTNAGLGRIVHYRGREGLQTLRAAIITATSRTLDPRGVDAGTVEALDSPQHVHLQVFTPGRDGFAETNVPYGPGSDGAPGPGCWAWPRLTRASA